MKFIVKTLLLFIVLGVVLVGCNDQTDTSTCPDGYTLIDDDCICNELEIIGYCINRSLPDDNKFQEKGQYGQYYNEETWCVGFESLPQPMLTTLEAYVNYLNHGPAIYYGTHEEEYGLNLRPHWLAQDSFASDTLIYRWAGVEEKLGFMERKPSNDPRMYTKELNGEILYLRCYVKILHRGLLRIHFTWENSNDEIRETCTRIFHK